MSRELFTDAHAELNKSMAGKLFRPSNGTEGEMFCATWCEQCSKYSEGECHVFCATLWLGTEDQRYPREWTYGDDGQPKCTAFEQKGGE
jgi:hypothetical protein